MDSEGRAKYEWAVRDAERRTRLLTPIGAIAPVACDRGQIREWGDESLLRCARIVTLEPRGELPLCNRKREDC